MKKLHLQHVCGFLDHAGHCGLCTRNPGLLNIFLPAGVEYVLLKAAGYYLFFIARSVVISTNSIIYLTCQNRPTKNRTTMLIGPAASLRRRPSESHGSILGVIRQSVFRRIEPRRSHCSERLRRCYEALAQSGDSALTADVRRMNSIDTRASWRMAKVRRALYLLYLPARHGARRIGGR